jgi:hypothetical protein
MLTLPLVGLLVYISGRTDPRAGPSIAGVATSHFYDDIDQGEALRRQLINLLRSSTHSSLKSPRLAAAWIRESPESQHHLLFIEWIEDHPTVDGIVLMSANGEWQANFAFERAIINEMTNVNAKTDLVYTYIIDLDKDTGDSPQKKVLRVSLLRFAKPIGDSVPVYRMKNH